MRDYVLIPSKALEQICSKLDSKLHQKAAALLSICILGNPSTRLETESMGTTRLSSSLMDELIGKRYAEIIRCFVEIGFIEESTGYFAGVKCREYLVRLDEIGATKKEVLAVVFRGTGTQLIFPGWAKVQFSDPYLLRNMKKTAGKQKEKAKASIQNTRIVDIVRSSLSMADVAADGEISQSEYHNRIFQPLIQMPKEHKARLTAQGEQLIGVDFKTSFLFQLIRIYESEGGSVAPLDEMYKRDAYSVIAADRGTTREVIKEQLNTFIADRKWSHQNKVSRFFEERYPDFFSWIVNKKKAGVFLDQICGREEADTLHKVLEKMIDKGVSFILPEYDGFRIKAADMKTAQECLDEVNKEKFDGKLIVKWEGEDEMRKNANKKRVEELEAKLRNGEVLTEEEEKFLETEENKFTYSQLSRDMKITFGQPIPLSDGMYLWPDGEYTEGK